MSYVDNGNNVDANVVIAKLQARLGEAMTVIAVLEAQLEAAQSGLSENSKTETVKPEVVTDGRKN